jgi:hypothetical protein
MLQPDMLEDQTCPPPQFFELSQDPESLTWSFDFTCAQPCTGDWRFELLLDASYQVKRR